MGAGKSTHLLNLNHRLTKDGYNVIVAKPEIDTRDKGVIRSRIGLEKECLLINDQNNIVNIVKNNTDFILIDEAQFLTENQVIDIVYLVNEYEIDVICYGLRTDYRFQLFEGSQTLFAYADELIEIPYNPLDEDKKITHMKFVNDMPVFEGNPIEPGDEIYKSVSRKKWFQERKKHVSK
jgi:thymidine kinase